MMAPIQLSVLENEKMRLCFLSENLLCGGRVSPKTNTGTEARSCLHVFQPAEMTHIKTALYDDQRPAPGPPALVPVEVE